ncbi:hypothetical protein [Gemella morbillorum]|uniref:hypothetical protein n=1 Tax=Gemella morbillorum TaxID=29391 RepID=UPI0028D836F0|nr:hypothetical protein [Gemella morbillorum]
MSIGVIINNNAIFLGGTAAALVGIKLLEKYEERLNLKFGLCSIRMRILLIDLMKYISAVVFALYYRNYSRISV